MCNCCQLHHHVSAPPCPSLPPRFGLDWVHSMGPISAATGCKGAHKRKWALAPGHNVLRFITCMHLLLKWVLALMSLGRMSAPDGQDCKGQDEEFPGRMGPQLTFVQ